MMVAMVATAVAAATVLVVVADALLRTKRGS